MITVELRNVIMHGHHGIYQEEKEVMNTFEVNLDVSYDDHVAVFEKVADTISYVSLYEIVRKKFQTPVFLLEKICQEIIHQIKKDFPQVSEVNMSIYKLQAPIQNFQGKVGVNMSRHFD
jgi:7,8-dihydroneopterin aldolase/epimerase/oxygenase